MTLKTHHIYPGLQTAGGSFLLAINVSSHKKYYYITVKSFLLLTCLSPLPRKTQ